MRGVWFEQARQDSYRGCIPGTTVVRRWSRDCRTIQPPRHARSCGAKRSFASRRIPRRLGIDLSRIGAGRGVPDDCLQSYDLFSTSTPLPLSATSLATMFLFFVLFLILWITFAAYYCLSTTLSFTSLDLCMICSMADPKRNNAPPVAMPSTFGPCPCTARSRGANTERVSVRPRQLPAGRIG
jgi:hypothetical protein